MNNLALKVWDTSTAGDFASVLASIVSAEEMKRFLRDVLTEKEIIEICSRLQAASMLSEKEKYTYITEQTKLSSRTVARISDWMKNGCGGYRIALDKLANIHHAHIPPVSAD